MSRYRQLFEEQLTRFGVKWCRDCKIKASHKRGFATSNTVHFDSQIGTRASLYGGFHEIGHTQDPRVAQRRSYEREAFAEAFAIQLMRELGVPIPRGEIRKGRSYVARKKRAGDRVIAARRSREP